MTDDLDLTRLEADLTRAFAFDLPTTERRDIKEKLEAALVARPAAARRRGLARRRALIGLAAALLITGTVAAGKVIRGDWGPVDHPATVADIEAEIAATMAKTPLPPGYAYPIDKIRNLTEGREMRAMNVGTLSVQSHAMCAWTDYWLGGFRAHDEAVMAAALPAIKGFPRLMLIADPRFADDGIREQIADVVRAATARDSVPVQGLFDAASCQGQILKE
jgi:hypothetical protein